MMFRKNAGKDELAEEDFAACRDLCGREPKFSADILAPVAHRVRLAAIRRSFPAERNYLNNQTRLLPIPGSTIRFESKMCGVRDWILTVGRRESSFGIQFRCGHGIISRCLLALKSPETSVRSFAHPLNALLTLRFGRGETYLRTVPLPNPHARVHVGQELTTGRVASSILSLIFQHALFNFYHD